MTGVTIAMKGSGPRVVDATYRNGVWAITPYVGSRGRLAKTRFVVTHWPTGCVCNHGLDPMTHEAAILLCRALGAEFPDYLADHGTVRVFDRKAPVYRPPNADPSMGRRIRELHADSVRAAQAAQSNLRTLRKSQRRHDSRLP